MVVVVARSVIGIAHLFVFRNSINRLNAQQTSKDIRGSGNFKTSIQGRNNDNLIFV